MANIHINDSSDVNQQHATRTIKVENDRLDNLKISYEKQVKEFSRGLSWGAFVCTL